MMDTKFLSVITFLLCLLLVHTSECVVDSDSAMSTSNMAAVDIIRRHDDILTPKPRKRGKRGGVRARIRNRGVKKPFMPVILLSNARSLCNKTDELCANTQYFYEYRESSILCFTETWMNKDMDDKLFNVDGFHLIRSDRTYESEKDCGGGICFYFNKQWTNVKNIKTKTQHCDKNIELLTSSVRPYFLPREFSHVIFYGVYIPPEANHSCALETLNEEINKHSSNHPNALHLVLGDFNHCTLTSTRPDLHQYITCPTRGDNTLDLCYGQLKNAYKCRKLPALGASDHDVIHLTPAYKSVYKRTTATQKTVRVWTDDTKDQLRSCFASTDWTVFTDNCDTLDELTDTVTEYINFCKNNIVETKSVKCFQNNKPWVNKDLKTLLNKKKRAFLNNDRDAIKDINKQIKKQTFKNKIEYKNKIESKLSSNDTKGAWDGFKTASGMKSVRADIKVDNENEYADELNAFYARFDEHDFRNECSVLKRIVSCTDDPLLVFDELEVKKMFSGVNANKSQGPDQISGKIIKTCYDELSYIFCYIFNMSFRLHTIPRIWKLSEIIPVPKKPRFQIMNDLRPVALTSIIMKCFERLVLSNLKNSIRDSLDPFQFAYREKRNVEDAIIIFVNNVLKHLEGQRKYARCLFIDFSSAFNTIQPHMLTQKLLTYPKINKNMIAWILDFLTSRQQYVKLNNVHSNLISLNTGAPQGCVLSPTLYTMYTNDFKVASSDTKMLKFADDTAIQGLMSTSDDSYFMEIAKFVQWCKVNFLILNVLKTKEIIIDFRILKDVLPPVTIENQIVEIVQNYKYLGLIIDEKLNWRDNSKILLSRLNQRLYFLRRLRSFNFSTQSLKMFYMSIIESIVCFGISCWGSSICMEDKHRIEGIIRKASKIIKSDLNSFDYLYEKFCHKKFINITNDKSHPLCDSFQKSGRSGHFLQPAARTERYLNTFVPSSVRVHRSVTDRR